MNYSLYFHIPFCTHRCAYCDFNTYAGQERLIPAYVEALCREVRSVAARAPERLPVHTIFFGGGTPSLLTTDKFEQILQTVRDSFDLANQPDLETCLEANPGTVTLDSLGGLRRAGFNRISFGVQSFQPGELRQLERIHDPFDVLNAVRWARQAGFDNLNLDLIYGLPEQPLNKWQANVKQAVALSPQHLSLYALTIEQGTPYGRWAGHGLLAMPDPDLAADMYEWASEYLEGQGYEQYEISNWARPGFQCRHNLQYWRNLPYLGFGAGAHGCAKSTRVADVLRIRTYIDRLNQDPLQLPALAFPLSPATVSQTRLTHFVEMQETMMLGLRLTQEGVAAEAFLGRFGQEMQSAFGKDIEDLIGLGLLERDRSQTSEVVRLTRRGRLLGNQVFMRFVGE
ncbi:MAG: radical SAM family heme chaperone HemW [Anaerolineales bacterium]|jgi:oxygen-independent coproporphyrinogen-3 oxidase